MHIWIVPKNTNQLFYPSTNPIEFFVSFNSTQLYVAGGEDNHDQTNSVVSAYLFHPSTNSAGVGGGMELVHKYATNQSFVWISNFILTLHHIPLCTASFECITEDVRLNSRGESPSFSS